MDDFSGIEKKTRRHNTYLILILICFIFIIYSNSFKCAFIFDDYMNIVNNQSIKDLTHPFRVLKGSANSGISGRPAANLSFALNYAISGLNVWSYHVFNLVIHIISACLLYCIILKTLLSPRINNTFKEYASTIAFFSSLLWAAHPIQTEAVTYITERIESLMGCCFLATLYFSIKGWENNKTIYHYLAISVYFIGTCVKEIIVVAPILILLYDILFVHNDLLLSLKQSKKLYYGLVLDTIWLMILIPIGGTLNTAYAGIGILNKPITWYRYFLNQPHSIATYLKLSFLPIDLSFSYEWVRSPMLFTLLAGLAIVVFISFSIRLLIQRRQIAYLPAWFFLILAPTTTVLPLWCDIEEHRMYLSLASITIAFVLIIFMTAKKYNLIGTAIILSSLLSLSLGCLTYMRNFDYRDGEIIWNDVIAKRPHNAAAYLCLATIYHRNRNFPKAIEYLNIATKKTDTSVIHYNLGVIYDELRNNGEAIKHYKEAIAMNPNDSNSMNNMALSLVNLGKVRDAVPLYQKAVALSPKNPNFYANLATAMALIGNMRDSLAFFAKSLEFNEANSGVHEKMAVIYAITGDRDEAIAHLKRAVTLDPNNLKAQEKLAFLTGQGFRGCVPPAGSLRRH